MLRKEGHRWNSGLFTLLYEFGSDKMRKMETLKKNYQFKKVLTKGTYFFGKQIVVYIRKNHLQKNRLGIALHTKLAKAVKRNRVKRLIRENYRLLSSRLQVGNDIVFLWNKKVELSEADFFVLQQDMQQIFKKAGIFIDEETVSETTTIL